MLQVAHDVCSETHMSRWQSADMNNLNVLSFF